MTTAANPGPGAMPTKTSVDPFVDSPSHPHALRYAAFDQDQLSLYSNASPAQAKRALEAHLKDTDRRIQDASKLGTTLLQQRKDLAARLSDVEQVALNSEVPQELKDRLTELEKEYTEVGKESARAFLPKPRNVSEAMDQGNPAVFSTTARESPSKASAPSRRQRNQTSNRVHDIEFATEISTSLLAQVRQLQAALADKDDNMKAVAADNARLESEASGLAQRVKQLDESEQRYKDATWELETRLQDLEASHRDVSAKQERAGHALNLAQSQKASAQRELDELKATHTRLAEEHTNLSRQRDADIHSLRRDAAAHEAERTKMQKRIDEIVGQNQELAKAIASGWRAQSRENEDADLAAAYEDASPNGSGQDESEPVSPIKGTPARNGMLESETLKTSLTHAHRMIQNLKNNIHREKTEKIELRRMLADARDELETRRDNAPTQSNVGKKRSIREADGIKFKKPDRPGRLGASRHTATEVMENEPDWEDDLDASTPSKVPSGSGSVVEHRPLYARADTDSDAGFQTANETEGFETANERDGATTESDAFQTGAESLSGDSDADLTETEGHFTHTAPTRNSTIRGTRPIASTKPGDRSSLVSTASASTDEEDLKSFRTPQQNQGLPKYRLRVARSTRDRRTPSAIYDSPQIITSSPAVSLESREGTPQIQGQSLGDELDGIEDDESVEGTPSSMATASVASTPLTHRYESVEPVDTPEIPISSLQHQSTNAELRPAMVDSGMMTDPWEPEKIIAEEKKVPVVERAVEAVGGVLAGVGLGGLIGHKAGLDSEVDDGDADAKRAARDTTPEAERELHDSGVATEDLDSGKDHSPAIVHDGPERPVIAKEPFTFADIVAQETEPVAPEFKVPASTVLAEQPVTSIGSRHPGLTDSASTPPESSPQSKSPKLEQFLAYSHHVSQDIAPEVAQETQPAMPALSFSSVEAQETQPAEPVTPVLPVKSPGRTAHAFTQAGTRQSVIENHANGDMHARSMVPLALRRRSRSVPSRFFDDEWLVNRSSDVKDMAGFNLDEYFRPGESTDQAATTAGPVASHRHSSSNNSILPLTKPLQIKKAMVDEGAQTMLAGSDIEKILKDNGITGHRENMSRRSVDIAVDEFARQQTKRPSSSGSTRSRNDVPLPPLPADHTEKIAAAQKVPTGTAAIMGPPTVPASAYKKKGPSHPTNFSREGGIRPAGRASVNRSEVGSVTSGRSSISSFASEVDQRFKTGHGVIYPDDIAPATDPRMIQAITQTMIGEYLWKYTRKAGRNETSNTRHRRFFWVHPYTRTLYWSEQDPSTAGRDMLKAKSVSIRDVRVITDSNAFPPGLHRKSLVVVTPGREIVFTAPTGQRHETWFNAMSYLLLRTEEEKAEAEDHIDEDDVAEFNPGGFIGRSISRVTGRSNRSRTSLSSYNSRTTRTSSPHLGSLAHKRSSVTRRSPIKNSPTTLPATSTAAHASQARHASMHGSKTSRFGSLSGGLRSTGAVRANSALANRSGNGDADAIYEANVIGESAEDLRNVIERQEQSADRLENVRACCDGEYPRVGPDKDGC